MLLLLRDTALAQAPLRWEPQTLPGQNGGLYHDPDLVTPLGETAQGLFCWQSVSSSTHSG